MKKLLLILAVSALLSGTLHAEFGIGGCIGINPNAYYGDSYYEDIFDPLLGFHATGLMQLEMMKNVIIQPELIACTKGASFEVKVYNGWGQVIDTFQAYENLTYLNAALLGKLNMDFSGIEFQPCLGFYLGTLLAARDEYNSSLVEDADIKKYMNSTDLGLVIGADAILMKSLMAGVKLDLGLLNVYKDDIFSPDPTLKNMSIRFSVGYILRDLKL